MSIDEARARIKSRVWQALAQSDLAAKELPKEDLETLVDIVTAAAMLELDAEIAPSVLEKTEPAARDVGGDEKVLWEGKPLLSLDTRYLITNERVRIIKGLIGKDKVDVELVRVQDISQSQSVGERLFNIGDLLIYSHDRSDPTIELRNVAEPEKVHEILRRAVLDARKRHGMRFREEM
jgi:hypothetical protein